MPNETYTLGTTPADVIKAKLPHKYPMELNQGDILKLLECLKFSYENMNQVSDEEIEAASWAMSMRTSILQTIGIEEI